MSLARNRSCPESRPGSQPEQRAVEMEFVEHRGSSAGAAGLLVVPSPNYPDLDVDFDDDDEDIVIGIRPKSSPLPRRKTSIDEEDSDTSEPPSLSGSRRVSFADAVGLSLVQIKEFDKWDVPQLPDFLDSVGKDQEEYFISPFNFKQSLSSEEIAAKVTDQKVELESIELLPKTTILKGIIRVLNVSFTKTVFVRTSLDNWVSHFDLLCEFIPGLSDGQTDSFSFKLTLVPPFPEQGTKVDFCLRYETPCGTFWANNSNRNYVLFCYKRKKEVQDKPQRENVKKSCLKTVSPSVSVEESMSSLERDRDATDGTTRQTSNNDSQPNQSTNSPAERSEEDGNESQVENRRNRSRRNRRKAARAARVRDHFAQKDTSTQDSEPQPSTVTQTETAQEHNKEEKHRDCKGNIQLEGNAHASLPNDSNSKEHEKLDPADAAISTDESPDESKDLLNTASTLHQNINKFVSSSSEERSLEAASDCTCLSGERVDREELVSDSGGFAFGTVVAPLYQQVSCRVGGQAHSETCSSPSTKDQREGGGRSSSGEMNDYTDIGLCCSDEKVKSIEQGKDIMEMPKDAKEEEDGAKLDYNIESQLVETNITTGPIPMDSLNCILFNSSKISGDERKIQDGDLSLDNQLTHDDAQAQLLENSSSHIDKNRAEIILETGAQENPCDLEKQSFQCNTFSNLYDPNVENNVEIVASSLSNTLIQEEKNIHLPFQTSQSECLKKLESSCNVTDELSLEFVGKTSATALEDLSGKSAEESESLLLQSSEQEGLVDKLIKISDAIEEPSIDDDRSNIFVSPNHVTKEFNNEKPTFTSDDLQNDSFLYSSTNPSKIQEISMKLDDKTIPDQVTEMPERRNQSLLFEQICEKNMADESTNTTSLLNETSLDNDASFVSPSNLFTASLKEDPYLTSRFTQDVGLAEHSNMNQVFEAQTRGVLPTSVSETPDENSLLGQNVDLGDKPSVGGTVELPTIASKFYKENSSLSLQLFQNEKFTSPDQMNVDHNESMVALLSGSENVSPSMQLSQNETLPEQPNHRTDPVYSLEDSKVSKTLALSPCHKNHKSENPYLPIKLSENTPSCLVDQPTNSVDLVACPYKMQKFAHTMDILTKEEGETSTAHIDLAAQDIKRNSDNFSDAMEEKEVPTSCTEIMEAEIRPVNIVESDKSNESARETALLKEDIFNCIKTNTFATDEVKKVIITGNSEQCEISSQVNTMSENLQDKAKHWETTVDKKKEVSNGFFLQTENEEIAEEVSDSKVDLDSAEQLEIAKAQSCRTDAEDAALNEVERAQKPTLTIEKCFDSTLKTKRPALCTNDEENEGDHASKSSSTSELNECIASKIESHVDNLPASESMNVDYEEKEKVKIHWKADEEERSDISAYKVECNLSAPVDNVQEGTESILEKIGEETTDTPAEIDKTDFPHCCKDTNDRSEGANQVTLTTFTEDLKCEQTSDNDSNSDSESGSEDEMELYMHCLRAVCGQQSSPKATRAEQNREKEFKRLSMTKGKRLSTSLPSISESLDEEQQCLMQEKDPERVEVQAKNLVLPDSSPKDENAKYLWWKETFSCRNILKTMLYATLVLVFLAVAYHYDFIACFGLYLISVIWLFFQGERQTGKNNRVR